MHYIKFVIFIVGIILMMNGCAKQYVGSREKPSPNTIAAVSSSRMILSNETLSEVFAGDDLTKESLINGINQSINYYKKIPPAQTFTFGKLKYSAREMIASMNLFLSIINKNGSPEDMIREIQQKFFLFKSASNLREKVLFTGYYEPIFYGSLKKTKTYNTPLYSKPDNLKVLHLGKYRSSLRNRTIVYRLKDNNISPYFTRKEIMEDNSLKEYSTPLAWLTNPVDLFFLQVQGSGIVELPSGEHLRLSYHGSNGHKYSSIGKLLLDEGKMPLKEISMASIREYIKNHPESKKRILYHNKSYVFFKVNPDLSGPKGNINVPLTPNRSVATDASIFPKGALGYIITKKPTFDTNWNYTDDEPLARFVINQDTGGAIRGTGRVDIFWGNGKLAERSAGKLRSFGRVYFLVARKDAIADLI